MEFQLLLHNILSVLCVFISLGLASFTYFSNPKKIANITLAVTLVWVAIFYLSHVIGVNTKDSLDSRNILLLNFSIIWIIIFNLHCVIATLGKTVEQRYVIIGVYCLGMLFTLLYLFFPDTFLLPSEPKMYFPNYYVPGSLHILMRIVFNAILPVYTILLLIKAYTEGNLVTRNRLKYFLFATIVGYSVGFIPVFLIYDIPINPNWGIAFIILYGVPFVYGAVTYELLDIRILARRALGYALTVVILVLFIGGASFSNQFLLEMFPYLPAWLMPSVVACIAGVVGFVVWNKTKQSELLKYEFVTIIAHKFRTPITEVKWALESMSMNAETAENKRLLQYVSSANDKLRELTNALILMSEKETSDGKIDLSKINIKSFVDEIHRKYASRFLEKNISFEVEEIQTIREIYANKENVEFILNVLLDNARVYTPSNGSVRISLFEKDKQAVIAVHDAGIGLTPKEMPFIFDKFNRSERAKKIDTEGLGVGLFMAKQMANHIGAKLWAESKGENQGTTFFLTLPM